MPVPDLTAIATLDETEGVPFALLSSDPDLLDLLEATAATFGERFAHLPQVSASVSTSIPRSVGLAGSSALIIALLRALGTWENHKWDPVDLAELALSVERDRLGIEAGLQDRLVQAVGKPVAMTFDPVGFDTIEIPDDFNLFVAWTRVADEPSSMVHRSLRRRFDGGDDTVRSAMTELAIQAGRAKRGIVDGDAALLADAMHRTMAIRIRIVELTDAQRKLVEIGRSADAAIEICRIGRLGRRPRPHAQHLDEVVAAYRSSGFDAVTLV